MNATNYEEIIAQATCGGLSEKKGWVFAVKRSCEGNETCEQICEANELKAQDEELNATT